MRYTLPMGIVLVALTFSGNASGNKSDCALIKDHDDRMTCYAVVEKNPSWCGFIKDADKRAKCRILSGK